MDEEDLTSMTDKELILYAQTHLLGVVAALGYIKEVRIPSSTMALLIHINNQLHDASETKS